MCELCAKAASPTVENPVDATAFAQWLRSIPSTESVGTAQQPGHCPIALYLRDALHVSNPAVNNDSISWYSTDAGEYRWAKALAWQDTFIRRVDDHGSGYEIDALTALDILRGAANLEETAGLEVLDLTITTNDQADNDDIHFILEVIDHV
jgi:hypothetical protein